MRRPARGRRLVPRLDALEHRTLLAAPVGVNVSYNIYYGSTNRAYVDVRNLFRSWYDPARGDASAATLPRTADGYPLVPAQTFASLGAYPSGTYDVSFRGQATLSFERQATLDGPIVTGPDGVSRGKMAYTAGDMGGVILNATNLDPANPFRDLTITLPGHASDPGQMYTDEYLKRLQPFTTLRFMDWAGTNGHVEVNWSDRVSPTAFDQASNGTGSSWEFAIELANEARKDIWINVPDQANDDYVRQLARLVRDRLNPDAKVYVEYSNELWNGSFPQYKRVVANAAANPLITATDDYTRSAQQSALRLREVGILFREEFGAGQAARVLPIHGAFAPVAGWGELGLSLVNSLYGDPSRFFSGLAISPYVHLMSAYDYNGQSLDGLFAAMNKFVDQDMTAWVRDNVALAARYRLPLMAYEGGQHLTSGTGVNSALKLAAQTDPRMGQLYDRMLRAWESQGGGLFMHYSQIGPYSNTGSWGLLQSMNDRGSAKWDAVLKYILPAGDLSLDGVVDYADFAVLRRDYDSAGRFWEDGDFDGDGVVGLKDLDILRANIGRLTPAQAAEVAILGTPARGLAGQAIALDAGGKTGALDYTWTVSKDGVAVATGRRAPGTSAAFAFTPATAGNYVVFLAIGDGTGGSASASAAIAVASPSAAQPSSSATYAGRAAATGGSWAPAFGAQGYALASGPSSLPAYAAAAPAGNLNWTWASATSDPRALALPGSASRLAATWYAPDSFTLDVNLADGQAHALTLYALDWDYRGRSQRIDLVDPATGATLDSRTASAFESGAYFTWQVRGRVLVRVTRLSGPNAVLSALFLDGGPGTSATYAGRAAATGGSWAPAFGAQGYALASGPSSLPAYAAAAPAGNLNWTWASATSDPRALALPGSASRLAATWYAPDSFTLDVNLADGQAHALTLYALDWDYRGRSQRIDLVDPATGATLDSRTASAFESGAYFTWQVRGRVLVRVTRLSGPNAVLSALFLDPTAGNPGGSIGPAGPATQVVDDGAANYSATGSWFRYTTGGADGDYSLAPAGASAVATWSFPVAAGRYRVLTTWVADPGRASNATYAIANGATALGSVAVDQRSAPSGRFDPLAPAVAWQYLGGVYSVAGNTLTVRLAASAAGSVVADSVLVERLEDAPVAVQVVDDGGPDFAALGPWTATANASSRGGSQREAAAGSGAVASWSFAVTPGQYRVLAKWSAKGDRAVDATYVVLDGGTVIGAPSVNQRLAPVGPLGANDWQQLGRTFTVTGSLLTVRLAARASGSASADAVQLIRLPDDTPPTDPAPAPWLQVADDSAGGGYAALGPWKSGVGGYGGTANYIDAGPSAVAYWTFAVTPGLYRVSTTYQTYFRATVPAPFEVLDGATRIGVAYVNQAAKPSSFSDPDGKAWQDLGGPYLVTGSTLTVRLSTVPGGSVVADAVRLERLGPG